jgi:hypothetical protein
LAFAGAALAGLPGPPPLDPGVIPDAPPGTTRVISIAELPPDSRKVVQDWDAARRLEAQRALSRMPVERALRYGRAFVSDCDEDYAAQLDRLAGRARPWERITASLRVTPTPLRGNAWAGLSLLGYWPDFGADGGYDGIARLFAGADGTRVELMEWNFVASGGGATQVRELLNAEAGPWPAVLTVGIAPSGREIWRIAWFTPTRHFWINLSPGPGAKGTHDFLMALAASVGN